MFSIYGISGKVFQGPLEGMDRVRQVSRVGRINPIAGDVEEAGSVQAASAAASPFRDDAVRAYDQMLHPDLERGPIYRAAQVMHGPVISVAAEDAVAQAWRILRDQRIHQAPVLDAAGTLVGIVSERDLLTAIDIDGERVIETLRRQVRDVMTTPVVAAAPVTDIRRIAAAMLAYDVDGVPVADDDGKLVGFVSRSDVLRAVVTDPPLSLWR